MTSDSAFRTPFARGYEVLEELPYREKALRAALRERGIGRLTIKKRGVDVVPDQLRKRLDAHRRQGGDDRADPGGRPGHLPAGPPVLSAATIDAEPDDCVEDAGSRPAVDSSLERSEGRAVRTQPSASLLRADRGVVAVAGVHDGLVGQREEPGRIDA